MILLLIKIAGILEAEVEVENMLDTLQKKEACFLTLYNKCQIKKLSLAKQDMKIVLKK